MEQSLAIMKAAQEPVARPSRRRRSVPANTSLMHTHGKMLTDPVQAKDFVEKTGFDAVM